MNPFIDDHQENCILKEPASMQHNGPIAYLTMDIKNLQYVSQFTVCTHQTYTNSYVINIAPNFFHFHRVTVNCSRDWHNIHIYSDRTILSTFRPKRNDLLPVADILMQNRRRRRSRESILKTFFVFLKIKYKNFKLFFLLQLNKLLITVAPSMPNAIKSAYR